MQELRPVMWFQFFCNDEDQALQQWEAAVLRSSETASCIPQPQELPEALQWVTEHYDPKLKAAEMLAEQERSASLQSGTSSLPCPGIAP